MSFRQMRLAFLFSLCLAVVFSSCQRAPELSSEALIGIWRWGPELQRFNQDGTYQSARSLEGLDSMIIDAGTYQLEGTKLTLTSTTGLAACAGDIGVYELELTSQGVLNYTLVRDECRGRGNALDNTSHTKITP